MKTVRNAPALFGHRRMSALQMLQEWLEEEVPVSHAEKIRQMREAYFADVDELERSGTLVLPK